MNKDELMEYIGREDGQDEITLQPLRALSATLDHQDASWNKSDPIPPAWQWLYFLPLTPQSKLDIDGHAARGGALPATGEARRMFVGGRMSFHRPLRVGDAVTRESSLLNVTEKQGRSGKLAFATIQFNYLDEQGLALEEQQDLVFRFSRNLTPPAGKKQNIPTAQWDRTITPDAVMLFRFSALTFNGHRIHYDRPYAQQEGYPDILVHGPLLAILLLDLAARHVRGHNITAFSFRATGPAYVNTPIALRGNMNSDGSSANLAAYRDDGVPVMTAEIKFANDGNGAPLMKY